MSFSVGIIGLPNVGKSTLFKALTKKSVDIADYPFTTIKPNVGLVAVPDKRLEKITEVIKPEKITPNVIEFVDIAGLIKNAHKGEGLGNQFLAQVRSCDALVQIIKAFDIQSTPENDIKIIKTELELKDLESKEGENLLSKKPILHIINTDKSLTKQLTSEVNKVNKTVDFGSQQRSQQTINLKEEVEISELTEKEISELGIKSGLDQLILNCYNILDLITFYTITGGKETKAWTVKKDTKCPSAGGKVHSDFEEKFIRAEIINWHKLVNAGSWKQARELGQILTTGKEYTVQDGDVIEFKI